MAPTAAAKVPPDWVGMLVQYPMFSDDADLDFDTGRELEVMQRARVGTIRAAFYGWNTMPEKNGPPDLEGTDEVVLESARHDVRVLPVVLGLPTWAREFPKVTYSAPTPRGRAAYAELCRALVRRYGPDGTLWDENPDVDPLPIRHWQLWNEVRLPRFWKGRENRIRGYVRMLRAAYPAIKRQDRGATVVAAGSPGGRPVFVESLYKFGGRRVFDAIGVHPFTYEVSNIKVILERYRRVLDEHGDDDKLMYVTELSWPSAYKKTSFKYGYEVTEAEQAVKLRQGFEMLARYRKPLKIAGVYWASWVTRDKSKHDSFDYSGLRKYDAKGRVTAKPALRAFVKEIRKLVGA